MNGLSIFLLALGTLLIILGYKNTQDNVISVILGRPYGNTTLQ